MAEARRGRSEQMAALCRQLTVDARTAIALLGSMGWALRTAQEAARAEADRMRAELLAGQDTGTAPPWPDDIDTGIDRDPTPPELPSRKPRHAPDFWMARRCLAVHCGRVLSPGDWQSTTGCVFCHG